MSPLLCPCALLLSWDVLVDAGTPYINPFQSNFSANLIPAEKQKEYNLCYLLAKVRTTRGKASNRLRQRTGRTNATKKHVGRHPTSVRKRKIIISDKVRRRIGKG